jgi:FtsH-binding integral membrane protein
MDSIPSKVASVPISARHIGILAVASTMLGALALYLDFLNLFLLLMQLFGVRRR